MAVDKIFCITEEVMLFFHDAYISGLPSIRIMIFLVKRKKKLRKLQAVRLDTDKCDPKIQKITVLISVAACLLPSISQSLR